MDVFLGRNYFAAAFGLLADLAEATSVALATAASTNLKEEQLNESMR